MRRKLKNLKNKSGHSENGAPRQLIDESVYRENMSMNHFHAGTDPNPTPFDTENSGWTNASRPRDQAISLRTIRPRVH
jgi:hypothetical protein